jgi:hypothetical protein
MIKTVNEQVQKKRKPFSFSIHISSFLGESVVQFRSIEDAEEALSQFNNVYYGGANVQIVPASEYEFASALDSFIPASVKKRQPEGGYCVKVIGKDLFFQ